MPEDVKAETEVPAQEVEEKKPMKKQVLFVLGGPGAGKGTQCLNVVRRMRGWATISAGDVLRACRKENPDSEDAKTIEKHISAGTIVPVEITIKLINDKMQEHVTDKKRRRTKFLIDGFPRNMDNVTGFEKICGADCDVRGALFFDVPEEEMVKRVLERAEKDAEKGEKRSDDTPEGVKKRLETNLKECAPIVKMYEDKSLLKKIDGNRKPNEVWKDVQAAMRDVEKAIRVDYPGKPRPEAKGKGKKGTEWIKVEKIDPNQKRCSFFAKVCKEPVKHPKVESLVEVQCGDETGTVTCVIKKDTADAVIEMDKVVRFQNVMVRMRNNFIRVETDRWGVVKKADDTTGEETGAEEAETTKVTVPEIKVVKTDHNISAVEFEAVDQKTLTGEQKSSGKGKGRNRRRKGKGKGEKKDEKKEGEPESKEGEEKAKKSRRPRSKKKTDEEKAADLTKAEDAADDSVPAKPKRTRKGKGKRAAAKKAAGEEQTSNKEVDAPPANAEKKKRSRKGRSRKPKEAGTEEAEAPTSGEPASTEEKPKKKGRGKRARKGSASSMEGGAKSPASKEDKKPAEKKEGGKSKGKGSKGRKGKGKGKAPKPAGSWVKKEDP
ncbi:unnamed protein product [Amoebophrya sp. A120]|nr:unnamed protein product [Amoebophrya sp. A120]|eukprot:GSA120T00005256001.1